MNKLIRVANTITGNERAWGLYELHEQSPGSKGFHRYQIIQVIRDGQIAEFRKDLGLASNFKHARQIRIPSLLEHTVDELIDIADQIRNETVQDEINVWELVGILK